MGILLLGTLAHGDIRSSDQSGYSLLHPTPADQMREMSTDRPDKTESAYTVDAGHFQVEMDIFSHTIDRHNPDRVPVTAESSSFATINLKAGLLNNMDLQLVLEPYTCERIHDRATGVTERHHGFGDITTRLKFNVWGNDGGSTALALMPFIKLPSNQNGLGNKAVEGGLIVPLAVGLPAGWSMGVMTELDVIEDGDGRGHHPEFINSITFSHDIFGRLGGYVEFFSSVSTDHDAPWVGTVDLGLTYALTDNIQLDTGVNIGVTRAADDLGVFAGISWRF